MRCLLKSAIFASLVLAMPAQMFAAEPFYERLMENGIRAHAEGNTAQAIQDLTLACFGMLEEPEILMTCRIHLALAQASQEDRDGFLETADRVLALERRFEVYRKISLAPSRRSTFEGHLGDWVSFGSLNSVPVFAALAHAQQEKELLNMLPEERRSTLEGLLAVDPSVLPWQILMAEAELNDGEAQQALERAEGVLKQDTELLGAICVRGEAYAALGNCEEALMDLFSCDESGSRPEILMKRLECQVSLRNWDEAKSLLDSLPASEKRNSKGRALGREIRRGEKEDARRPAETPEDATPADDEAGTASSSGS